MSRIGKEPVKLVEGVTVTIEGQKVTAKGKLGELSYTMHEGITANVEDGILKVACADDDKYGNFHGLARALINNMVIGVSEGYKKELEINGVGYRAAKEGNKLVLTIGYSHPVVFEEANGVKFECPDSTTILVKGIDKQAVGQIAAVIRSKRPPEPYLGKGVKYSGERIRRKAGKTGK